MIYAAPESQTWTALDLVDRFGAIPLSRVLHDPTPGTATVDNVVQLDYHQDRLCELIDGTLVEKTVGAYESYLAVQIATLLNSFVSARKLGVVLGTDGMMRLVPGQVRIPDASFISNERLHGSGFPHDPVPQLVPDLAVEIISKGNTTQEMDRKLHEYFTAGVRLVWYFYPEERVIRSYTSERTMSEYRIGDTLTGDPVLVGFSLDVEAYFSQPWSDDE